MEFERKIISVLQKSKDVAVNTISSALLVVFPNSPFHLQSNPEINTCVPLEAPTNLRRYIIPTNYAGIPSAKSEDSNKETIVTLIWDLDPRASKYNFELDDPTTTGIIDGINKEPDIQIIDYPFNTINIPLSNNVEFRSIVSAENDCGEVSPQSSLTFRIDGSETPGTKDSPISQPPANSSAPLYNPKS